MKKIFTLLLALFFAVGHAYAEDFPTYEWYINGKARVLNPSSNNLIEETGSKKNLNANYYGKFKNFTGEAITCTTGLKMEGATEVTITLTQEANITIIQSRGKQTAAYNDDKTIKFNGSDLPLADATTYEINASGDWSGVRVHKIDKVQKGIYKVTRGSGESGIVYIGVQFTGPRLTTLTAPTISVDETNGLVTISKPEDAKTIVYTLDGSRPNDNSEVYTAPFIAEDGVTVKALSLGSLDDNTADSDVVSKLVELSSGKVANPTFKEFNGAFSLSCKTANVTYKYSLDGGTTWKDYILPVTVFKTTDVQVQAFREGWDASEIVSQTIEVEPYVEGHESILIGFGSFTVTNDDKVLEGKIGDPERAMGISLSMDEKTFSSGGAKIKLYGHGNKELTEIKGSNGAEITMSIPEGMQVTRITFYNLIDNNPDGATPDNCRWSVLYGDKWESSGDVPEESHDPSDPAVRVFTFDHVTDQIVFKHDGTQPFFCMAVNVVYDETVEAPSRDNDDSIHYSVEDGNVNVELFPAMAHHEIWYKQVKVGSSAAVQSRAVYDVDHEDFNKLEANSDGKYIVTVNQKEPSLVHYYSYDPNSRKKSDVKTLVFNDASTGLEEVLVDGAEGVAEYYNLQGQRVLNPEKGNLYIVKKAGKATKIVF